MHQPIFERCDSEQNYYDDEIFKLITLTNPNGFINETFQNSAILCDRRKKLNGDELSYAKKIIAFYKEKLQYEKEREELYSFMTDRDLYSYSRMLNYVEKFQNIKELIEKREKEIYEYKTKHFLYDELEFYTIKNEKDNSTFYVLQILQLDSNKLWIALENLFPFMPENIKLETKKFLTSYFKEKIKGE